MKTTAYGLSKGAALRPAAVRLACGAALLGAFALPAGAETVYLMKGGEWTDGIDQTTAQNKDAGKWAERYTDGQNVHAGADYVYSSAYVKDGVTYQMSAADAMIRAGICQRDATGVTFAGDSLQVGSLDEPAGSFAMKQRQISTSIDYYGRYAKLILCDGTWYVGGTEWVYVGLGGGTIEVRSPEAKPFHFYNDLAASGFASTRGVNSHGTWSFRSALSGEAGVALKFSLNDSASAFPYDFRLTADNSAYKGKFIVRNAGARLTATQSAALGASDAPCADAITLADGGALAAPDGADVTLESATRGVTVDATGGRLSAAAGSRLVVRLPVSGSGPVYVCGGGEVVLDCDYAAGAITVAGDTLLTLGASANLNGAAVAYEGDPTFLPEAAVTNEFDFAAKDGKALAFCHAASLVTRGCYTATGLGATWPMALKVMGGFVRPSADARFPVLRIPTALKAVTADDFFVSGATPYDCRLTVETDEDGMQTVVLTFPKVLQAVNMNNTTSTWKDGDETVDAYAAYAAKEGDAFAAKYADYAWNMTLGGEDARRIHSDYHTAPYLGSPFSVKGLGTSAKLKLTFALKAWNYTWDDLRFYGNIVLFANDHDATVGGKLSVLGGEDEPTELCAPNGGGATTTIAADICGDGFAQVLPYTAADGGRTVAFTGDNGRFLGTFDVGARGMAAEADVATNFVCWTVSSANGFGGNPAAFTVDAVRLGGGTTLKVAQSLTMPHANRGFTVRGWPTIDVAAGQVFRIRSKTTIAGRLTKTGEGLLILDDVAAEAGSKLVVAAGNVSFGVDLPSALEVDYASGEIALPNPGTTAAWPADAPAGAKVRFECRADGTASGTFEMSASAKPGFWPVGVTVVLASRPAPDAKFPVLRIPTSVRAVTLDDFYSASRTPYSETYSLETGADGVQTLFVSFPETLTATRMQSDYTIWQAADGTCYTNTETAAYAYRVDETSRPVYWWGTDQLRVSKLTNPFAGQSLSIAQVSGTDELPFPLRFNGAKIPELRLYGNVSLRKNSGGEMNDVGGDLTVLGTEENPTAFRAQHDNVGSWYNASFNYAGRLRGDGYLALTPVELASTGVERLPRFGLGGDNSRFVGTLDVTADATTRAKLPMFDPSDGTRTNNVTLEVTSSTAFGGALPAFDAKAVRFGWSSLVKVHCDVTLAANRGLYAYDSPCVEIDKGATFEVPERTTLDGTLTKAGEGTLRIGALVAAEAAAGANAVTCEAGGLVLTRAEAVRNVRIVAPSVTLVISRDAAEPLVNAVDDLPFGESGAIRLAWAEGKGVTDEPKAEHWIEVPLMDLKSEAAAASIKGRIAFPRRTQGALVTSTTADGLTRLTLRARIRAATCLIIR